MFQKKNSNVMSMAVWPIIQLNETYGYCICVAEISCWHENDSNQRCYISPVFVLNNILCGRIIK